jgi:hypothetical protein
MGRNDLIGNGPQHLVPRTDAAGAKRQQRHPKDATPPLNQLAKKFGQNKPRPGGAVTRKR